MKNTKKVKYIVISAVLVVIIAGAMMYVLFSRDEDMMVRCYTSIYDLGTNPTKYATLYDCVQTSATNSTDLAIAERVNPKFFALLYFNLPTPDTTGTEKMDNGMTELEWIMTYHPEWRILYNGSQVYSREYPSEKFMDIVNPAYRDFKAQRLAARLNQKSYFDGVMLDNSFGYTATEWIGDATIDGSALTDAQISSIECPSTGLPFTETDVVNAFTNMLKKMRVVIGSKLMVCNGVWHGGYYYDKASNYQKQIFDPPVDGFASEGLFVKGKRWQTLDTWNKSLHFLCDVQNFWLEPNAKRLFFCGYSYDSTAKTPNSAPLEQVALFWYASILLGVQSNDRNVFVSSCRNLVDHESVVQPLLNIKLGMPVGQYYEIIEDAVFARDYTKVKVMVNPTEYQYTINLGGTFYTRTGGDLKSVTLPPHTAEILLKSRNQ